MSGAGASAAQPSAGEGRILAKICGITDAAAMRAAVEGGAAFVGLVFYPPSPRALVPADAAALAAAVPAGVTRVGLFVDPDDAMLESVLHEVPLDLLQLHGRETPERTAAIRACAGRPVMKVIPVGGAADVDRAATYEHVCDRLMFDAKPPKTMANALPGGNALSFEWKLLAGRRWRVPWMLAGGLTAGNVAAAVATSGATAVDTSSGVEDAPGRKCPRKIDAFLAAVAALSRAGGAA